jgi:hypothetical protein
MDTAEIVMRQRQQWQVAIDAAVAPALPTETPPDWRRTFTVIKGGQV